MKLYATTTSERGKPATKGGNKELNTAYNIYNRNDVTMSVRIKEHKEGFTTFRVYSHQFGNESLVYNTSFVWNVTE